jgi:2-keto-4-pentenoate hydratase/2-oxohepta-3-ene-1,7-dioic acid hydratase in catechol pathway
VVIGKPAYNVGREQAVAHIAGLVCLNDTFLSGPHHSFVDADCQEGLLHQNQGLHVLYKTGDCQGGMGPWITTSEELADASSERFHPYSVNRYTDTYTAAWIYDRKMTTHVDGDLYDESYTGAYLLGAEWPTRKIRDRPINVY